MDSGIESVAIFWWGSCRHRRAATEQKRIVAKCGAKLRPAKYPGAAL